MKETDDGTVKIQTERKFIFECHREMREAYQGRVVAMLIRLN